MEVEIIGTCTGEEVYGIKGRNANQEDLGGKCLKVGRYQRSPWVETDAIEHTQSIHGSSSASIYISSQPVADSGTLLIREMHTHRCTRFSNPPPSRADIFEDGKESVSGSISTWNMISEGKPVALLATFSKEAMMAMVGLTFAIWTFS